MMSQKYIYPSLFQEEEPQESVPGDKKEYDLTNLFERLAKSDFRSRFHLSKQDREYVMEKGLPTIRKHAEDFVAKRLAPAVIPNDGKQTPMRGHPVFLAQHATGCCCRGCFFKWHQQLPTEFSVGIPLQLLSNRPDVKAAEMSLAANYYNTNSARAAFYPQITLSGSGGWTNNSGAGIVNPGKLLASAIGSLTQPLFYRGANIARLKQAKAQEEQAKIQFQTALLNAGNEVSNALHLYQMEKDKAVSRTIQVNSARQAASDTKELFNLGTSTYLEVLSAEQSYLSAQLAEVSDTFSSMQAVISLYQALGGGRE